MPLPVPAPWWPEALVDYAAMGYQLFVNHEERDLVVRYGSEDVLVEIPLNWGPAVIAGAALRAIVRHRLRAEVGGRVLERLVR